MGTLSKRLDKLERGLKPERPKIPKPLRELLNSSSEINRALYNFIRSVDEERGFKDLSEESKRLWQVFIETVGEEAKRDKRIASLASELGLLKELS